jgi:hypothetical protein
MVLGLRNCISYELTPVYIEVGHGSDNHWTLCTPRLGITVGVRKCSLHLYAKRRGAISLFVLGRRTYHHAMLCVSSLYHLTFVCIVP